MCFVAMMSQFTQIAGKGNVVEMDGGIMVTLNVFGVQIML